MTNGELIALLQSHPADMEVQVYGTFGWYSIERIQAQMKHIEIVTEGVDS